MPDIEALTAGKRPKTGPKQNLAKYEEGAKPEIEELKREYKDAVALHKQDVNNQKRKKDMKKLNK